MFQSFLFWIMFSMSCHAVKKLFTKYVSILLILDNVLDGDLFYRRVDVKDRFQSFLFWIMFSMTSKTISICRQPIVSILLILDNVLDEERQD